MRLWAQDACVRAGDLCYDGRARRVVIMARRFCWECEESRRVATALRIESVMKAQRRNWPSAPATPALELLAMTVQPNSVTLTFAGGAEIRMEVECLDLILEDIGDPAAASTRPAHSA